MQPTDNQMNDRSIPCFSLGNMDVSSFTTTHRALISSAVESAVYWAVSNKLEEVEVYEIMELDVVFSLKKEEFGTALNGCIEYSISIEDYEKCVAINKLKTKL